MLIVCDNCGAEYEIDDDEDGLAGASGRGIRFRCSACGHTFGIGGDASASTSGALSDPGVDAPAPAEPPPMLLKQEGKVYQVEDIATLQRWIVERRVLREDLFSLGGLKWEPVGSRRDLQVFFHLVDDVERSMASGAPVTGPPVDDLAGGAALQGAAPWESAGRTAGAGQGGDPSSDGDVSAMGLDHEGGVDAGLPVGDLPPASWHREGSDYLESHGDADSFFTEAGDVGLPVPAVPNLAAAEGTADPESAGQAADEEVDPSGGVVPVVLDGAQSSSLRSLEPGPEERFDRYLDRPADSDPFAGRQGRAGWSSGQRWLLFAAVLTGLVVVGWTVLRPRSSGSPTPVTVETPTAQVDAASSTPPGTEGAGAGGAAVGAEGGAGSTGSAAAPGGTPRAASEQATAKAAAERAAAERAAAERAAAEQAAAERAAAEQAAAERAAAEQAAAERAAAKAAAERAAAEQAAAEQAAAKAAAEQAAAEQAAAEQAAAEQAVPVVPSAAPAVSAVATSGSTAELSTKQLIDLGWKAIDAGDYATGRSRFDTALARSPHDAEARFGLGYAYEKLGNLPAAVRQYCKVTRFGYGDALVEAEGRLRALGQRCE